MKLLKPLVIVFLTAVAGFGSPMETSCIAADSIANEGDKALDLGEYPRAETIFTDALKQAGKDDPQRAFLEVGLSEALLNQGRFKEAEKEYKKAQSLVEARKVNDELLARLYDGLSWLYHAQGKFDDAIDWAQKALVTRKAAPDASVVLMVATLTHLGQLSELTGKLQQAGQYYQQAIGFQDQNAGPGSIMTANLAENLGSVLRRLGDVQKSKECFEKSLSIKLSTEAVLAPYEPHAYWHNVTYSYSDGSPNCTKRFNQGTQQEIVTANGVTVAAALLPVETTKSTQVNVYVRNDSNREIQFLPIPPALVLTQPKISMVPQVDGTKLAQSVAKKGDRKAAWIRFWGENATQTLTSTYIGGGGGFYGYPPISYGGYGGWGSRSGNMTIMNQQVPNYLAQARALQRAADVSDQAHASADSIKASGIGPTNIPAGQSINGNLYFDATKVTGAVLRLPIGNGVFEFEFPPH